MRACQLDVARLGRITRAEDFASLRSRGRRQRGEALSFVVLDDGLEEVRVAFAFSRKSGIAVNRNLVRRRVKEVFRAADLHPGMYLVLANRKLKDISFADIVADVTRLTNRN